jgi:predicted transcriptional regulator
VNAERHVVAAHVPPDFARQLHQQAQREDRTVSSLVREAIRQYLYGGSHREREEDAGAA